MTRTTRIIGIVVVVAAAACAVGLLWSAESNVIEDRLKRVDARLDMLSAELGEVRARTDRVAVPTRPGLPAATPAPDQPRHTESRASDANETDRVSEEGTDESEGWAGHTEARRLRFQKAVAFDMQRFTPEQLREIDALYNEGLAGIAEEQGRARLARLIDEYPDSNRAGCAAMNLAATLFDEGDLHGAEGYLEGLIASTTSSVFASGERVLPKALYNYGRVQARLGNTDEAHAAWQRILDELASETDAHGGSYASMARERLSR